jgi:hypothetical protein
MAHYLDTTQNEKNKLPAYLPSHFPVSYFRCIAAMLLSFCHSRGSNPLSQKCLKCFFICLEATYKSGCPGE